MQHAESFRELIVYQQMRKVAQRFLDLSKSFPKEERYSLTDQGRRSSRSIIRNELVDELERMGRMLPSMADKADLFCGPSVRYVREGTVEYFVPRSPITDHRSPITDYGSPITWVVTIKGLS